MYVWEKNCAKSGDKKFLQSKMQATSVTGAARPGPINPSPSPHSPWGLSHRFSLLNSILACGGCYIDGVAICSFLSRIAPECSVCIYVMREREKSIFLGDDYDDCDDNATTTTTATL